MHRGCRLVGGREVEKEEGGMRVSNRTQDQCDKEDSPANPAQTSWSPKPIKKNKEGGGRKKKKESEGERTQAKHTVVIWCDPGQARAQDVTLPWASERRGGFPGAARLPG